MGVPTRVELEPAWVLHTRQYRETSLIVELFTAHHGRMGVVARGVRSPKSPLKAVLRPFQPLVVSWSGRGDLATLQKAECSASGYTLDGVALAGGFYASELLLKLLQRRDPHPLLFAHYSGLMDALESDATVEVGLRNFELTLLRELGFGLNLSVDAYEMLPLEDDQAYEYRLERGVVPIHEGTEAPLVFAGAVFKAIEAADWSDPATLKAGKRLLRYTLDHYLDGRELQTRKVYTAMSAQLSG